MLLNLGKQDKDSQQGTLRFRMFVANIKSVNIDNFPKVIGATMSSNPLLPGEVFKYLDAKAQSVKPNATVGESPYSGKLEIDFVIEGISKETLAWIYENQGEDFVIIWQRCSDGQYFIAGDPCSGGLKFSYQSIGVQDGGLAGIACKFTGQDCPNPYLFYDGPVPLAEPDIIPADATSFALSDNPFYQLSENTAAKTLVGITNVTDGDVGRLIEISGSGNKFPTTIIDNAEFTLSAGIDYVAKTGSKITFQIKKSGAGYSFYEVSRS